LNQFEFTFYVSLSYNLLLVKVLCLLYFARKLDNVGFQFYGWGDLQQFTRTTLEGLYATSKLGFCSLTKKFVLFFYGQKWAAK